MSFGEREVYVDGTPAVEDPDADVGAVVAKHVATDLVIALRGEAQLAPEDAEDLADTILEDITDTVNAELGGGR